MTPVIVYGPHASGKTRHAEAIKDYFGLTEVKEEWRPDQPLEKDTLHLTTFDAPSQANTLPVCTILHISEALRLVRWPKFVLACLDEGGCLQVIGPFESTETASEWAADQEYTLLPLQNPECGV